jgi:hypothetical protein
MSTLLVANIHLESTANNRIHLTSTNTVTIVAGGSNILSVNSTSANVSTNTFNLGASSKTANGYTYLTNGVLLQWCTVASLSATTATAYNFPIAFPTQCLAISTGGNAVTTKVHSYTTSAVTANCVTAGAATFVAIGN